MLKIMLACSAGMSTSLLVTRMQKILMQILEYMDLCRMMVIEQTV